MIMERLRKELAGVCVPVHDYKLVFRNAEFQMAMDIL